MSEGDDDEDEEKKTERQTRRVAREVRLMRGKLTRLKEKEMVAKQEQNALKMAKKTQQLIMKYVKREVFISFERISFLNRLFQGGKEKVQSAAEGG